MRRAFLSLGLAATLTLTLGPAAQAKKSENIQFNAITCKEFVESVAKIDAESVGYILMWLDGYLSGVSGDTMLNWDTLESFSERIIDACSKNPGSKVLAVAKKIGIRN